MKLFNAHDELDVWEYHQQRWAMMSVGSSRTLDCLHSRTFSVVLFPNYLLKLNKKFEKYSISVHTLHKQIGQCAIGECSLFFRRYAPRQGRFAAYGYASRRVINKQKKNSKNTRYRLPWTGIFGVKSGKKKCMCRRLDNFRSLSDVRETQRWVFSLRKCERKPCWCCAPHFKSTIWETKYTLPVAVNGYFLIHFFLGTNKIPLTGSRSNKIPFT